MRLYTLESCADESNQCVQVQYQNPVASESCRWSRLVIVIEVVVGVLHELLAGKYLNVELELS